MRAPQKRLVVNISAAGELGQLFAPNFGAFERYTGVVTAHWLPQAQGDKYELAAGARCGRTFGPVPLDELFILGVDLDDGSIHPAPSVARSGCGIPAPG